LMIGCIPCVSVSYLVTLLTQGVRNPARNLP